METPIFELWVDRRKTDRRSGLEGLLQERQIAQYAFGKTKHIFIDTPSSSLPKIFFFNKVLSNEICHRLTDPERKLYLLQQNENIFEWCNKHGIQCYLDRSWEILNISKQDGVFITSQDWWKFLQNYNIKIMGHSHYEDDLIVNFSRFFEFNFRTDSLNTMNRKYLFYNPNWFDKKKYLFCSYLGSKHKELNQEFLVYCEQNGLLNDQFFWTLCDDQRHKKGKIEKYDEYEHLFKERLFEDFEISYSDNKQYTYRTTEQRRVSQHIFDSEYYITIENHHYMHTEKSLKPIFAQVPFFTFAEGGSFSNHLKTEGYEIYDELFDYSNELTIKSLVDEMIRLKKNKDFDNPLTREKITYNYYHYMKRSSTEEFIKYIVKKLIKNK